MENQDHDTGPILRLFQVRVKAGCANDLLRQFATTSADVVRDEPGNRGYFFGRGIVRDDDQLIFASVWTNLDAIKLRFGNHWNTSYLPEGYGEMIEECSVWHLKIGDGWFVDDDLR